MYQFIDLFVGIGGILIAFEKQGEVHLGYDVNLRFDFPYPDSALYHQPVHEAEKIR